MSILLALQGGGTTHNAQVAFDGVGALALAATNENRAAVSLDAAGSLTLMAVNESRGAVAFDGTGDLTAAAQVAETQLGAVSLDGMGDLTAEGVTERALGVAAPIGYPVRIKRKRTAEEELKELLERVSARTLYEEISESPTVSQPAKERAANVVRPFAKSNKLLVPPSAVDWQSIESEIARVQALLVIWEAEVHTRLLEADDEEVLLAAL
jgi:hypothetical protein